jgi:cob(I)alamin adenosyltransferase
MGVNFPYARSSFEVVEAVARRAERRLVVLAVDGHVAGIGISD